MKGLGSVVLVQIFGGVVVVARIYLTSKIRVHVAEIGATYVRRSCQYGRVNVRRDFGRIVHVKNERHPLTIDSPVENDMKKTPLATPLPNDRLQRAARFVSPSAACMFSITSARAVVGTKRVQPV